MSSFNAPLVRLAIVEHPNADALEIAKIDGYECVVAKGQFRTGDCAVYIPEQAVLPDGLIEKLGLVGKLAGSKKNRVKAIKLRGVLSQGLLCPLSLLPEERKDPGYVIGLDCSEILGLIKHEPVVPATMAGNVWNAGPKRTLNYDIENIKKYPRVLEEGEEVIFTEKIHGTWCMICRVPLAMVDPVEGALVVSSKGHAARGLALKKPVPALPLSAWQKLQKKFWQIAAALTPVEGTFPEFIANKVARIKNHGVNENNIYWRIALQTDIERNAVYAFDNVAARPMFVLGEIFGTGVQDLGYGLPPSFRVFDIYIGYPGDGRYLSDDELHAACFALKLDRVPVLYRGPYSTEKLKEFTGGRETVSGKGLHVREGIVIRPTKEREAPKLGRVQLKSINPEYLLRKGDTTEYQ